MLTDDQRREYINTIRTFPADLRTLIAGLSPEQLTTPYLDDEWTVAQNVHHVADSHLNSYVRVKLMITEDHPTLRPYDQDVWATLPDATAADVDDSLMLLEGLHQRWVTVWQSLQAEDWQRTAYHPENGDLTLDDQLRQYADHCRAHLDQIQRTLAAAG